jgi:hypothetical protein
MWAHSHELLTDSFWGTNFPRTSAVNQLDCATLYVSMYNEAWWEDHDCLNTVLGGLPIAPICQLDVSDPATNSTIL